ncbi:MAG TPA: hypothetical protein VF041_14175 [Gemmatimonadaceae bacterium]
MRISNRLSPVRRHAAALLVALCLPVAGAAAQNRSAGGSSPVSSVSSSGGFRFSPAARSALHVLWTASLDAKQERVACLGGHASHDTVYITSIEPVSAPRADSANISARTSLAECAPPRWFGTVHTHIAKFAGQPFIIFSAPDRMVMSMWRRQWHQDGVFCILFSATEANCEAGYRLSGQATYSDARGSGAP